MKKDEKAKKSAKKATTKPIAKKAVAKPVAKKAVAKPVAKKAVAKPVPKKAAAKPVAKKAVAKPVAKKAIAKPVAPKTSSAKKTAVTKTTTVTKGSAATMVEKKKVVVKTVAQPAAKKTTTPAKAAAKPVAKKAVAKPVAKKAVAKPVAKKAVAKPVAKKPAAKKVAAPAKPVVTKPVSKKTVAPAKPVAAKPAAKKATPSTKPAAKKVAAPAKPVVAKPVATEPAAKGAPAPAKASAVVKSESIETPRSVLSFEPPEKATPRSGRKVTRAAGKRDWEIKIDGEKFYLADESRLVEPEASALSASTEFAERYGDNRIVALVRDPFTLHVYWELTGEAVESARASLGVDWSEVSWVLRVYEVTGVEFSGDNARAIFEYPIDPAIGGRYVDVESPDAEYVAAIGLRDKGGRFSPLVFSNRVRTPRLAPSENADVEWAAPDELFQELYGLSVGEGFDGSSGSGGFGMGASEAFVGIGSSGGVSSFGSSEEMAQKRDRGFFFWLDCELIVYGGTAPDASVTLQGKTIQLRPDGTFSARFHLPDGVIDIPVFATSADKVETREISPAVTRVTRRENRLDKERERIVLGKGERG